MPIDYPARLERVRAKMDELGIELMYLPQSADLQWLTGIRRDKPSYTYITYPGGWLSGAFVGLDKGPILAVPRMIAEFDLAEIPNLEMRVLPDTGDAEALAREVLREFNLSGKKIAVEDRSWASFVLNMQRILPDAEFTLASDVMRPLRMIKDEEEIALMRHAGSIVDQALAESMKRLRPGISELEMLTEVDYQMNRLGSEAPSFPTALYIINPHRSEQMRAVKGKSTHPIETGIAVPFDLGAVWQGYCSDFGRTVWMGEPPAEYVRTQELVMASQAAGAAALKSGQITAAEVDAIARKVIEDAGYGSGFRHRLGHGIGMDVHERPFLMSSDDTVVQSGMCFTVEPSIIVDNRWMVRVEDVFVVRENGGEPLSHFTKELLVVA